MNWWHEHDGALKKIWYNKKLSKNCLLCSSRNAVPHNNNNKPIFTPFHRIIWQWRFILSAGGRCDVQGARRINLGGLQMISYLHRILQLKYPSHISSTTFSRAEVIWFERRGPTFLWLCSIYLLCNLRNWFTITATLLKTTRRSWKNGPTRIFMIGKCASYNCSSQLRPLRRQLLRIWSSSSSAGGRTSSGSSKLMRGKERSAYVLCVQSTLLLRSLTCLIFFAQLAMDEERLETMQIIRQQLPEVDDAFAVRLMRQVDITDENHLDQEIQNLQERISKTRQKMANVAIVSEVRHFRVKYSFCDCNEGHDKLPIGRRAEETDRDGRVSRMVGRNSKTKVYMAMASHCTFVAQCFDEMTFV